MSRRADDSISPEGRPPRGGGDHFERQTGLRAADFSLEDHRVARVAFSDYANSPVTRSLLPGAEWNNYNIRFTQPGGDSMPRLYGDGGDRRRETQVAASGD